MKIYFDNLTPLEANCHHLSTFEDNTHWLVPGGSRFKKVLNEMHIEYSTLDSYDEPGCYFVEVNGDPDWWAKLHGHILTQLPKHVLQMVRERKLRIIIAADREGGPMLADGIDCFRSTTTAMVELGLPVNSVLITQGNKKIEKQYQTWCQTMNTPKLFDVMYSNHFGNIFVDRKLPEGCLIDNAVANSQSVSFNSLNRVHRTHRAAHLYKLANEKLLDTGLISGNQIDLKDHIAALLVETSLEDYAEVIDKFYPRHIDGDWAKTNAANQYNVDIYNNSLMSFITETIFLQDVAFITEKTFKPITLGHPLILLASAGTLRGLEELGFKINWCGIDPSYNDIINTKKRFNATHQVLLDWINLPREEKLQRITNSMPDIIYNANLIRSRDFYKEAIKSALDRCEEYFNG